MTESCNNKYINQLIDKYEATQLWDIRTRHIPNKYFLMPVSEWLSIMNNLAANTCLPAFRNFGECKVQGICTPDKKYFLYESTCRYKNSKNNILNTFISISEFLQDDSTGFSEDYIYIRNLLDDTDKKSFSNYHTYLAYNILKKYPNFKDISSYKDFISRYVGVNGESLCKDKGVLQALWVVLNNTLKDEIDFKQLSWETYSEVSLDELKANLFYHDANKTYIDNFTSIVLEGGLIY